MKPYEIEEESFRIIRSEMAPHAFTSREEAVVVRVIHASADFDFQDNLRFFPHAVSAGIEALRRGAHILADVHMAEAGVRRRALARTGGSLRCAVDDPNVYEQAAGLGITRSAAAFRMSAADLQGGIALIGNAPTALLEVIRLAREEGVRPALVIGVPVGFVAAAESKDALTACDFPWITALGRKGGSPVAAAILNALLILAENGDERA